MSARTIALKYLWSIKAKAITIPVLNYEEKMILLKDMIAK